jgi:hypothetical protein
MYTQPPPAPAPQTDYTQAYRPQPGYTQDDDLAWRLAFASGAYSTPPVTGTYYAPIGTQYVVARGPWYRTPRGYPWFNTLFWGGVGAVIGQQHHRAWEGAALGAIAGHTLLRPGGMDPGYGGLITPNTLLLGGVGAVIGHQRGHTWQGAAIGAVAGRLFDEYRIQRRRELYGY